MKSVGESMGIGRTFAEAFAKARRGLEIDQAWEPENLHPWFAARARDCRPPARWPETVVTGAWTRCAGEVEAASNYFYSTRGERDEAPPEPGRSVVILGSGPNRIGQGIEFDYCCVHAAQSFRAQGYEAVMVNCNPETVSTDYDTSRPPLLRAARRGGRARGARARAARRRLHPVRRADAAEARAGDRARRLPHPRHAVRRDRPRRGPRALRPARGRGSACAARSGGSRRPPRRRAAIAARIGYPVLVRPSYVLGGRAMRVCYDDADVEAAMDGASTAPCSSTASSRTRSSSTSTRSATARDTYVAAVMEHVEEAGIHSGDSSCVLPAPSDDEQVRDARPPARAGARRRRAAERAARDRGRRGLRARGEPARVADGAVRVEGDRRQPRRRGVPPRRRRDASPSSACRPSRVPDGPPRQGGRAAVRALPRRRPGARARDALDRRGDGERRPTSPSAFAKAERAAGRRLPTGGRAFLSVRDARQGRRSLPVARALLELGFELVATAGTASRARRRRHPGAARREGRAGRATSSAAAASTSSSTRPRAGTPARDGYAIREAAVVARVPCITTLAGRARGGRGDREGAGRAGADAPGEACPRRERS